MRINLAVPDSQAYLARRRGASWDRKRRVWYVENVPDLRPFELWMPSVQLRTHRCLEAA